MKYSCGQALQMTPFFFLAHLYAKKSKNFKADGYSQPYQLSLSLGALLVALTGLLFWRRWLLLHFKDSIVAIVILLIGLGSNYFEYAGITGAMTHNNLLMLYAILLLLSHSYYRLPTYSKAVFIGGCLGLMALSRPTEIMAVLIPIMYGLKIYDFRNIKARVNFHKKHIYKILISAFVCLSLGSIQLCYWKYVSGDWLVYSYEEQGFSWLRPHILEGLFSYNNGWIPYSPIMFVSIIGLPLLVKFREGKYSFYMVYILLFTYVAFAWDIWWYGGSLGQRTMVQLYPVLSIPFAVICSKLEKLKKLTKLAISFCCLVLVYFNLWFVYQAHGGGMLYVEQMTKAYYWKTLGTWEKKSEHLALLDNKDLFDKDVPPSTSQPISLILPEGRDNPCFKNNTISLNKNCTYSPTFRVAEVPSDKNWLRVSVLVHTDQKEWNVWRMPQMILQYKNDEDLITKTNMMRLHRMVNNGNTTLISMDSKLPENFSELKIELFFWNVEAEGTTTIKNMNLVAFKES